MNDLDNKAKKIIADNDMGGYTIPTKGLYPYQWNWDSAFVALGFQQFDNDRAWREIETLLAAQWHNGMIPHIIFRKEEPSYYPGPSVWQADSHGPISATGISQPPVAASIIYKLWCDEQDQSQYLNRAQRAFTQLNAFHQWWHDARDIEQSGVVKITHPWESGRDNLPDWDAVYPMIDTSEVGEYHRNDTDHVNKLMRPTKYDYDCYIALVQHSVSCQWDPIKIAKTTPFWVADVGINAILIRAEKDLYQLALSLNYSEQGAVIAQRIARLEQGFETLWNKEAMAYCTLDARSNRLSDDVTAASFLCLYAGVGSPLQKQAQLDLITKWSSKVNYMVPSFDPFHQKFDSLRYWRGPVWSIVNYLIGVGLTEQKEYALAEKIRLDTQQLISEKGFAEYFSAIDGQGCGGDSFSWTAAIWLSWASTTQPAITGDIA
ncbi:trehalase family glycosidase [Gammaproteobacteria bacterium AS21]